MCNYSGGSRIFPRGAPALKVGVLIYYFCRKLHENERIWTRGSRRGARVPGAPLDPPMNYGKTKINVKKSSQLSVVLDDCVALLEHVIIIRISCFDIDFVSQIKLTKPFLIHCFGHGLRFPPTGVDPGFPWVGEGVGWDEVPLR